MHVKIYIINQQKSELPYEYYERNARTNDGLRPTCKIYMLHAFCRNSYIEIYSSIVLLRLDLHMYGRISMVEHFNLDLHVCRCVCTCMCVCVYVCMYMKIYVCMCVHKNLSTGTTRRGVP